MAELGELRIPAATRSAAELLPPIQAQASGLGVIPYIPALGRDGTAAWLSATGRPSR